MNLQDVVEVPVTVEPSQQPRRNIRTQSKGVPTKLVLSGKTTKGTPPKAALPAKGSEAAFKVSDMSVSIIGVFVKCHLRNSGGQRSLEYNEAIACQIEAKVLDMLMRVTAFLNSRQY